MPLETSAPGDIDMDVIDDSVVFPTLPLDAVFDGTPSSKALTEPPSSPIRSKGLVAEGKVLVVFAII